MLNDINLTSIKQCRLITIKTFSPVTDQNLMLIRTCNIVDNNDENFVVANPEELEY